MMEYFECEILQGDYLVDKEGMKYSINKCSDDTKEYLLLLLNNFEKENEQLKKQLADCERKKQNHKDMLMNSTAVVEQKKLQKIIYSMVIAMIDDKIKEVVAGYKHGDVHHDISRFAHDRLFELKKELQDIHDNIEVKGDVE